MNDASDIVMEIINRVRDEARLLQKNGEVCYPYVAGRLEAMIMEAAILDPAVKAYFAGVLEGFKAKEVAQ